MISVVNKYFNGREMLKIVIFTIVAPVMTLIFMLGGAMRAFNKHLDKHEILKVLVYCSFSLIVLITFTILAFAFFVWLATALGLLLGLERG